MVGQAVMGVLLSSMNAKSLSNQARRSGVSDISYNRAKFSPGYVYWKNEGEEQD